MYYLAWYNVKTARHEVLVQKDRGSSTATHVESFKKADDAERRAAELNSAAILSAADDEVKNG